MALGFEDEMLVSVQLEYSYQKLDQLELEPATADDFELVEQNSNQIEEQLLNQVGVFYRGQTFVLFLGQQKTVVRLKSIVDARLTNNCFYLTESCELHIAAKTRPKLAPSAKSEITDIKQEIVASTESVKTVLLD